MSGVALGAAVACLAGIIQGCTGFGLAMVIAPCLMLFLPPTVAVPVVVLLSVVNTSVVAAEARRHIRFRLVVPLFLGNVVGLPLGILFLTIVDPARLKTVVGLFIVAVAMALLRGWRKPLRNKLITLFPIGLLSGVLGGSTSISGPPVILFLANQETPKDVFRASIVCFFATVGMVAVIMYYWSGLITERVLSYAAVLLPTMLVGTWFGVRLSYHVPEDTFRKVTMIGVGSMGVILFITSVRSFL